MKKRLFTALTTAACLSVSVGFTAFAAQVSEQQAKDAVTPYLPSGSTFLYSGEDDGSMELTYTNETLLEGYKWKVNRETGALVSFESEAFASRGGKKTVISEDDAKHRVTREITAAEILSANIDHDDDVEYEIKFKTSSYYGTYHIHPETGAVLEREIKFTTWKEGTSTDQLITRDEAIALAKRQVPDGTVTDIDLDWEREIYCYEVELYKNGTEYTVVLNARTGDVLASYQDNDDWHRSNASHSTSPEHGQQDIGLERAKQIALELVPGGRIEKCEPDHDDGTFLYEIEIKKDHWEYEIEIDGYTGAVIKNERDSDD